MKQIIFFEFLNKLKVNPELKRKIKIFAVVGIAGVFVAGALMIWVGVSAINYLASSASHFIQSPIAQGQVENIKAQFKDLPKLQVVNCWGKVQSLLAVQPWLERPALDNLAKLTVACFEPKPQVCQGAGCEQMKELINTAEGSFI